MDNNGNSSVPIYTISACIREQRLYEVRADSEEEARDLFMEDFNDMDYEIIERELDDFDLAD